MDRKSIRFEVLEAHYNDLQRLTARNSFIQIQPVEADPGWPPVKYIITFSCLGVVGVLDNGMPKVGREHKVLLQLSKDEPHRDPVILWLTEIWHPNIDPDEPRNVCYNSSQTWFGSKPLSDLVQSLAEMATYQRYFAKNEPPFPQNREAAEWVRNIAEPMGWVRQGEPFDDRGLLKDSKP
jgi:ubiquitin-protein ligase